MSNQPASKIENVSGKTSTWVLALVVTAGATLLLPVALYISDGMPSNVDWAVPNHLLDQPPGHAPEGFVYLSVMEPMRPITEFEIHPVASVLDKVNPDELVIGVTVNGESRAYPINSLSGPFREILNDELGGRPIAATW